MDFRYNDTALKLEEELAEIKSAEKAIPAPEESGILRIAKGKTPLDEVRALIDSSKQKSAGAEISEYRVRAKLAGIRDAGPRAVESFLAKANR